MHKPLPYCLVALFMLALAGCASTPPKRAAGPATKPAAAARPGASPVAWIGRWNGPDDSYLQLMPTAQPNHYQLVWKRPGATAMRYDASAIGAKLYFQRLGETLAIRPGSGGETGDPRLAGASDCLIVVPGRTGYCRTPGTADALPLTRGTYVEVTDECWNPSPDALLYYDGRGLAPSGSHACTAAIMRQQGVAYTLADTCTRSTVGRGARATVQATVTVPDDTQFAWQAFGGDTRLYKYCPVRSLPVRLRHRPTDASGDTP